MFAVAIAVVAWRFLERGADAPPDAASPHSNPEPAASAAAASEPAVETIARAGERSSARLAGAGGDDKALVTGTLSCADGTPVGDADLVLLDARGHESGSASRVAGRFEFANVSPGHYWLLVNVGWQQRLRRELDVVAPRTHVDLQLGPEWTVTVKAVTPAGDGLLDAVCRESPRLFGERGVVVPREGAPFEDDLWAMAFTAPLTHDLPPSYCIELGGLARSIRRQPGSSREELERGAVLCELTVTAAAPVTVALLLRTAVLAQQTVEVGQDAVTFTLAPGDVLARLATVRLRLLDERGAPAVGAPVALRAVGKGPTARTDSLGRSVMAVLPGRWQVVGGDGTVAIPLVEVDAAPGAVVDLGDLVLRGKVAVPIAPLGIGGTCSCVVQSLDVPPAGCRCSTASPRAHLEGFTIQVHPGRYAIVARGTTQWAIAVVDTNALPPLPLRLEFRDVVPLRVESTRADGLWQVEIRTAMGVPVHTMQPTGARTFFVPMPQGSYEAAVTDLDGRRTTRAFTLGPDGGVLTLD